VLAHAVRRYPIGRRLVLAYKTLIRGDVSLNIVATRPGVLGPPATTAVTTPSYASLENGFGPNADCGRSDGIWGAGASSFMGDAASRNG
jgi:hypothetical protein